MRKSKNLGRGGAGSKLRQTIWSPYIIHPPHDRGRRTQLVLRDPLHLPFPTRFFAGHGRPPPSAFATLCGCWNMRRGLTFAVLQTWSRTRITAFPMTGCLAMLLTAVEEVAALAP